MGVIRETSEPFISIVIPTYNYAASLGLAVESVIAQLDDSTELLVIDDGSTDSTPEVVATLQAKYPGRFKAIRKANGGPASARNLGLDETCGAFLVFLDADDELIDGALAALRTHLRANPQTRMVIAGHWSVYEDGHRSLHAPAALPEGPRARIKAYLLDKTLSISNGACAMHREVFGPGRYPENFRNAEDIPIFAQILAGFPCTVLEQPLALIHKHNDSLRHDLSHARTVGLSLVDEVFSSARLPAELHDLKRTFLAQRCLSLFRTFYGAHEREAALEFYRQALRADMRVLGRWSYTRKALRLWFRA